MVDPTAPAQATRAKLTFLHIVRYFVPFSVALGVAAEVFRSSVCWAIPVFFIVWFVAKALIKEPIHQFAKLLWRHGRWRWLRLEGGWYLLTRRSSTSDLIEEIKREFPAQTTVRNTD